MASLFDSERNDVKIYIADCNNHCIRRVYYDQGDVETLIFKNVPAPKSNSESTTAASGADIELECDGENCYPSFDF